MNARPWFVIPFFAVLLAPVAKAQVSARNTDLPADMRSIAGLVVNRDSALSVKAKLGATRERMSGSGHDVLLVWCYVTADSSLLELMSDRSGMGTDGKALNVIRLRARYPASQGAGCGRLSTKVPLSTPGGLRLGLTRSEATARLGRPARQVADSFVYEFSGKEFMKPGSSEYKSWNTPERRKSCFEGGAPYSNVWATAILVFHETRAVELRLERYDQATC